MIGIAQRKLRMERPKAGQHAREIVKRLERNTDMGRRNWQVFEDFLEIAERNLLDQPMHAEYVAAGLPLPESAEAIALVAGLERHYPGDEHWDNFAQAYALLLDAADTAEAVGGSWDVLGEVFMEFGQPSRWHGQHFTTWDAAMLAQTLLNGNDATTITEALAGRMTEAAKRIQAKDGRDAAMLADYAMMAITMLGDDDRAGSPEFQAFFHRHLLPAIAAEMEPITVYDPTIGSGVMLMAYASMVPRWANDWGMVRYYGQDIDETCVRMCRINMMLHGLNGYALQIMRATWRGNQRRAGNDPDAILAAFELVTADPLAHSGEGSADFNHAQAQLA